MDNSKRDIIVVMMLPCYAEGPGFNPRMENLKFFSETPSAKSKLDGIWMGRLIGGPFALSVYAGQVKDST